ncbi:hypothetical protein Tco_0624273 [Tanacetum coccineum]|uniref:Uncharacterized protein n=1 Tax=Tanacetum coccineum TaxID=301880 RepID=A0ABQ4WDG5_9ASTR
MHFCPQKSRAVQLKLSTANQHIPKRFTQLPQARFPTAPNYASHSDYIIVPFISQQHPCLSTHEDEDLLQIDEDAMEELTLGGQVAMITARIRKFKGGRQETT